MKKIKELIQLQRATIFSGKRKIGLDTNILIKLYEDPYLFDYEEARIFKENNLVFVHKICLYEFIRYLCRKDFTETKAKQEAKEWLNKHNIIKIFTFIPEEELKKFENEINENFKRKNLYLKCHRPDSIILLSYKKSDINRIISTDNSFRESAKFLGMDGEGLPSLNQTISKKLRAFFDKRKHKKKH